MKKYGRIFQIGGALLIAIPLIINHYFTLNGRLYDTLIGFGIGITSLGLFSITGKKC
jgi:hypothetical protein